MVYSLSLTTTVQACTRYVIETENAMVSSERISEMISQIPHERTDGLTNFVCTKGRITFENVSARYRPNLDLVIDNLSFDIPGGTRVGVVGRTGAGKSSLGQVLFGMLPLASGRVLVDGVDTSTINLSVLRRNLASIPQSPVLFSGTVRFASDSWGGIRDDALL